MKGRNTGTSRTVGCRPRPSAQSNSSVNGGFRPCQTSSTASTLEPECLGQRLLGEPRIDSDSKLAERQLEQREPARRVEMVEHPGEHLRRIQLRGGAQPLDRLADADGRIVDLGRFARRRGPQQGHRLGRVADIVAAHVEQDRVDPLLDKAADRGRLDVRDVERPGERGEAIAAVGIGRFLEVIADQLELGVARARVDEIVEKLREGTHRASMHERR